MSTLQCCDQRWRWLAENIVRPTDSARSRCPDPHVRSSFPLPRVLTPHRNLPARLPRRRAEGEILDSALPAARRETGQCHPRSNVVGRALPRPARVRPGPMPRHPRAAADMRDVPSNRPATQLRWYVPPSRSVFAQEVCPVPCPAVAMLWSHVKLKHKSTPSLPSPASDLAKGRSTAFPASPFMRYVSQGPGCPQRHASSRRTSNQSLPYHVVSRPSEGLQFLCRKRPAPSLCTASFIWFFSELREHP